MASLSPVRAVITGGPGVGKSTLLAAAADIGMAVFPEVARDILRQPGGMDMRAKRPGEFAQAMLDAEIAAYHAAGVGPALYDRGFPDIVGFLNLEVLPVTPGLEDACRHLRYDGPIFRAPPWPEIYQRDAQRIQNWDEAIASDAAVCSAWRQYGYDLVDLPFASVQERLAFVAKYLQK